MVLNGWGVGEGHWGGLAQKARLKGGLAGTAARAIHAAAGDGDRHRRLHRRCLCVLALERHGVTPDKGEILVTGAAGGVGSVAVSVLSKLGYTVVGVSGRPEETDYVKGLGASEVLERSAFSSPGKPLARERWAGAVDVVGSHTLANVCASTKYRGVVTACGLAGGMDFPSTVAPFILRGVTLAGVDSVMCPREDRLAAWKRLGTDLDLEKLSLITNEISLAESIPMARKLLDGQVRGRVLVDVNR